MIEPRDDVAEMDARWLQDREVHEQRLDALFPAGSPFPEWADSSLWIECAVDCQGEPEESGAFINAVHGKVDPHSLQAIEDVISETLEVFRRQSGLYLFSMASKDNVWSIREDSIRWVGDLEISGSWLISCFYGTPFPIDSSLRAHLDAAFLGDGSGLVCWQDIACAPMDGTPILLKRGTRVTVGEWHVEITTASEYHGTTGAYLGQSEQDSAEFWNSWDGGFSEEEPPLQWMHLPSGDEP